MTHTTDLDLTPKDVAELASADAITALLAKLGYDTADRTALSPEAVGLTGESASAIKKIELLSEDPEQFLRVVFAQPKSLTAKVRNDLVRVLGKSNLDHLLVLASDFDTLEFVFLDKRKREQKGPAGGERIQVVPKTFKLDRRHSTPLERRILRRFTWTCRDALEQFDKLRSVFDAAAYTGEYFQNRGLFSDYFLRDLLREDPAWRDNPSDTFAFVRDRMRDAQARWNGKDKDTLRNELLEPLFKKLGFKAKVNRPSKTDQTQPDYLLNTGDGGKLTAAFVYAWDRWLDGLDLNDADTPEENPGACVVTALDAGTADWIIVTNGRLWRLYSRQAHARATNFYEVDLVEALTASGDTDPNEAFRYWWLFMRPAAFMPKAEGQGCWLDDILLGSREYAKRLGDRLKDRIFLTIFPHLAQGFLVDRKQRLGINKATTDEELADIFEATLTLLYRLLFLLYAESRDLLPIREAPYQAASLKKIKDEIADKAGVAESDVAERLDKTYSPKETALYDRLCKLFVAMDKGDPILNVPTYNGGLFNTKPDESDRRDQRIARFLKEHKVPDRYLALAIDRLARDQDERTLALVFIDYKSLEVRHLGSIYEGLLEFKLKVADEDLTTQADKKGETYIPLSQAKVKRGKQAAVVVKKKEVYLSNDKAERKASGSYYTPDAIVEYIVAHTVGPVLEEKLEALRPEFRKVRKTFERLKANADATPHLRASQGSRAYAQAATFNTHKDLVEQLFDLRVLDPAMGSGHFLVETVDFVTDHLLKFLNQFPINPVNFALDRTRNSILESLGEQGVTVDPAKLTDINLLKRHVLKRCIYGVDLNPMAVELAKVSLWLDAFTLGAPLNFLDHHLRCGNSLIGATFKDLEEATKGELFRLDYEPLLRAINHVLFVSKMADATAAEVATSVSRYDQARQSLAGYQIILDLLVAEHFGLPEAKHLVAMGNHLDLTDPQKFDASLQDEEERKLVATVEALAQRPDRRFFHWEIEFPEVFFGFIDADERHIKHKDQIKEGTAGFDCVVGNPPWGGLRTLGDLQHYLKSCFLTGKKAADWFAFFVERSLKLVRRTGGYGVVIPSGWQTAVESRELRHIISNAWKLGSFVNLPYDVFPDAYTEAAVVIGSVVGKNGKAWESARPRVLIMGRKESLITISSSDPRWFEVDVKSWFELDKDSRHFFTFWTPPTLCLAKKVVERSVPLSDLCDVQRGITPYKPTPGNESRQRWPALDGELRRYSYEFTGASVVEYHEAIAEYKAPIYFQGKRGIVRQLISRQFRIQAILTERRFVVNQSHQILRPLKPDVIEFVVGIVNSRLLSFLHVNKSALALRDDFPKLVLDDTRSFPIPRLGKPVEIQPEFTNLLRKLVEGGESLVHAACEHAKDITASLVATAVPQMMAMDAELREVEASFLSDLAKAASHRPAAPKDVFEEFQGKSTILQFAGDYQKNEPEATFDDIVDVLRRNKRKLPTECLADGPLHRLRESYEQCLTKVVDLKRSLARLDKVIDRLVYHLYDLNKEEILTVEASTFVAPDQP